MELNSLKASKLSTVVWQAGAWLQLDLLGLSPLARFSTENYPAAEAPQGDGWGSAGRGRRVHPHPLCQLSQPPDYLFQESMLGSEATLFSRRSPGWGVRVANAISAECHWKPRPLVLFPQGSVRLSHGRVSPCSIYFVLTVFSMHRS